LFQMTYGAASSAVELFVKQEVYAENGSGSSIGISETDVIIREIICIK
jgi:hypothetical protein